VNHRDSLFLKTGALALALSVCAGPAVRAASKDSKDQEQRVVEALRQDLKADPSNAELWVHLGFAYRKAEDIDQALAAFQKASQLNPQESDAFYMLGIIYENKRQKPEALQAWKDYLAVTTDPVKRDVAQKHIHHLNSL